MNVRDEFLPVAREMLEDFGAPATLTRTGAGDAPTATQKFNKAARTPASGIVLNIVTVIIDNVEGENDEGKRSTRSVAVMLEEPIEGDTLTINGSKYRIGHVTKIAPQEEAIYFEAEVTQ